MKRSFLTLLALWFVALPALADPYTIAGVPVDATGTTAIEAQTDAILEGQTRAAALLLQRLTLESDRSSGNYVEPTPEEATRMIRAMSVANEKRSAQRYIGDITVAFVPGRVRDYAQSKGLTVLDTQARRRVAIPIENGTIVDGMHPLSRALGSPEMGFSLTPVSLGDVNALLLAGISASDLTSGNMDALMAAAEVVRSPQILLVEASGSRAILYDAAVDSRSFTRLGSVSGTDYLDLARKASRKLQADWKSANASVVTTDPSSLSATQVTVLFGSLNEWQRLQRAISGSARIRNTRLDALAKSGALMSLTYVGDQGSLASELSGKGASLQSHPQLGLVITRPGYPLP